MANLVSCLSDVDHYRIVLCPGFEAWILQAAQSVQVNPANFNLPDDPSLLHKITQQENIGKNQDFKNFLREIKKKEPADFQSLKNWLFEFIPI